MAPSWIAPLCCGMVGMSNDYGNRIAHSAFVKGSTQLRIPLVFPPEEGGPNDA